MVEKRGNSKTETIKLLQPIGKECFEIDDYTDNNGAIRQYAVEKDHAWAKNAEESSYTPEWKNIIVKEEKKQEVSILQEPQRKTRYIKVLSEVAIND